MRTLRPLVTSLILSLLYGSACSGPEPRQPSSPNPAPAVAPAAAPASGQAAASNPAPTMPPTTPPASSPSGSTDRELATFGGGCFWCTEAVLEQIDGVLDVTSGYTGGSVEDPSYEQVCTGTTGHAESVQVTFDPKRLDYTKLLEWFFKSHDPTTWNRQGNDEGPQYRSVIFYHSEAQKAAAEAIIKKLQPNYRDPIVTEVVAATKFWPAELYHQDYFRNNQSKGYCRVMIAPKLHKLGLDEQPKQTPK